MPDLLERLRSALSESYTVERELGRGGMGCVFLAHEHQPARRVAIKVLDPDLAGALGPERFLREVELASRFTHPHILPIHRTGEASGLLYYVMPYVEGQTLRDRLDKEKQLPLHDAVRIVREVADALSFAHTHGVIHRDIKPENILLEAGHAVVADFGVARAVSAAGGARLTQTGIAVGTPAYMSPEQATGGEIDERCDIYSLGCVLYELLAGDPPFSSRSSQAVLARHLSEPPPPIRVVRPGVPEQVVRTIERALAKVPADRFATAVEMSEALAHPDTVSLPRPRRRRGVRVAATVGLLVALALVVWRVVPGSVGRADANRILVFPMAVTGREAPADELGQSVALVVVWAINTTTRLHAVDAWPLLDQPAREAGAITEAEARRITRRQGAAHFVTGSVLVGDSVRVLLDLQGAGGGGAIQRVFAVDAAGDPWALGLMAAGDIVRALVPDSARPDYAVLAGHTPAALDAFLEGERAYRNAHFANALDDYRAAFAADSTFTLAALRAAQAARWNHEAPLEAGIAQALDRTAGLPPRYAALARGLHAYLAFHADSAVAAFRRAIDIDPRWPEAWMALGEAYTHLLPAGPPPDSMAQVAFQHVRRLDPSFAPVLYHLTQLAANAGDDDRARALLAEMRAAHADSVWLEPTDLLVRCAAASPGAIDWRAAVTRNAAAVNEAAQWFTVGGLPHPACAAAAWRALLTDDSTRTYAFGGLLGLHSVLVGRRHTRDIEALLDANSLFDRALLGDLYLLAADAGAPVADRAAAWGDSLRALAARDTTVTPVRLWFLGIWEARGGRAEQAERIASRLLASDVARRATDEDLRMRRILAASLTARAAAARGDTTRAIELLSALTPTASSYGLRWNPWESLGGERVMLAELLLARGAAADAFRVASYLDAPAPIPYVMYLPASLDLRARAARSLGYQRAADQLAERRRRLLAEE